MNSLLTMPHNYGSNQFHESVPQTSIPGERQNPRQQSSPLFEPGAHNSVYGYQHSQHAQHLHIDKTLAQQSSANSLEQFDFTSYSHPLTKDRMSQPSTPLTASSDQTRAFQAGPGIPNYQLGQQSALSNTPNSLMTLTNHQIDAVSSMSSIETHSDSNGNYSATHYPQQTSQNQEDMSEDEIVPVTKYYGQALNNGIDGTYSSVPMNYYSRMDPYSAYYSQQAQQTPDFQRKPQNYTHHLTSPLPGYPTQMDHRTQLGMHYPTIFANQNQIPVYQFSNNKQSVPTSLLPSSSSPSNTQGSELQANKDMMNQQKNSNTTLQSKMEALNMWQACAKHKKGSYICSNHCAARFSTVCELVHHLDAAQVDRQYKCATKGCIWSVVGFTNRAEWRRHTRYQHTDSKYLCPQCPKLFTRRDSLKRHVRSIHSTSERSPNWNKDNSQK